MARRVARELHRRASGPTRDPLLPAALTQALIAVKALLVAIGVALADVVLVGAPVWIVLPLALVPTALLVFAGVGRDDSFLELYRSRTGSVPVGAPTGGVRAALVHVALRRPLRLALLTLVPLGADALMGAPGLLPAVAAGLGFAAAAAVGLHEAALVSGWEDRERARLLVEPGWQEWSRSRAFLVHR